MKLHAWYCAPLWQEEKMLLFGLAGGRVDNAPDSRWLYSLRIFMGVFKVEILWTTGEGRR